MKKILPIILSIVVLMTLIPYSPSATTSEESTDTVDYGALVGEANADSVFNLELTAPEMYKPGDEITVSVAVADITIADGLTVVRFDFYYDNSKLVITNDIDEQDNGNAKVLDFTLLEDTNWEECVAIESSFKDFTEDDLYDGVQAVPVNDGFAEVGALTRIVDTEAITEDNKLVFNFTFTVKDDAADDIVIYVPNASVEGGYNTEFGATTFKGNGGYVSIAYDNTPETSDPETSDPETSDPETSDPETSDPETSDPETSNPETSNPETSDPETSDPETSNPETSNPETSNPETSDPETSDPETSDPETSDPETSDPETSDPEDPETPDGVLGDVDDDGDVDAADYILVKRAVLKTYNLTEEQKTVADIDKDADVDATDYVLVKRIVLGTYKVK